MRLEKMNLNRATHLLGLISSVLLTACGGGGSGSSTSDLATDLQNLQPASEYIQITGAGIKGPLAFADAKIYAVDTSQPEFYDKNSPIAVAMSDQFAAINNLAVPRSIKPPYILTVDGSSATDLNTGMQPVISTLITVITAEMLKKNRPVYATPLTTLAYHIARRNSKPSANADTFVREMGKASTQVSDFSTVDKNIKFDITDSPLIINDATVTLAEQSEAVHHRAAVEAFAAKVNALVLAKGDGLHATYFNDSTLTGDVLKRTDTAIDFDWQFQNPATSINADNFSVRWTGFLEANLSEYYTFYTSTDDGVRLWIDGQLIIDQWTDQPEAEFQGTIQLTSGEKYPIKMEYYDNTGEAVAKLLWSSNSLPKSIVPKRNLYSTSDAKMLQDVSSDVIVERIAIDLQSDGVVDNMASGSAIGGIDTTIMNQDPSTLMIPNTSYQVQDIVGLMEEERVLIGTDRGPTFLTDEISVNPSPQSPPVNNTPPPAGNTPPPVDNTPPPVDNTPPPVDNTPPPVDNTPP
ncbi:MAG TPA: hypothetical protein ENI62_00405, partial [Gammaproteobacteria bacterium]|nr:hypothetical protein [Gammaproteobacteria bacterium]